MKLMLRNKCTFHLTTIIILIAITPVANGQEVTINGFLDTYQSVRIKEPNDYLASRTRLRLEARSYWDEAFMFVSVNAVDNNILPNQTGIELVEAYLEYVADKWDFRAGKQIIIWGNSDGVRITDVICPEDMTEFLAQDFDDTRIPVDALKFRWLPSAGNLELLWLPIFKPAIYPTGDNPWAAEKHLPDYSAIGIEESKLPKKTLKNSEIAGKLSMYFAGIDVAVSSIYTWDDSPVMETRYFALSDSLNITPKHHRQTVFGLEFSKAWWEFIIRGEGAFYKDTHFDTDYEIDGIAKKDAINWLIGLDWYANGNWTIMAQFSDYAILNYQNKINQEEHTTLATLRISKNLLRETLTLEAMSYIDITEKAIYGQLSIDYALSDAIRLTAGTDIFDGDEGFIGQYEDNSQIWVKGKYSF